MRGCFIQQPTGNPLARVFEPDVGFEPTVIFRCLLTRQVQSASMGIRQNKNWLNNLVTTRKGCRHFYTYQLLVEKVRIELTKPRFQGAVA